jgi:hypothetical protein
VVYELAIFLWDSHYLAAGWSLAAFFVGKQSKEAPYKPLNEGRAVEFEMRGGPTGLRAENVTRL